MKYGKILFIDTNLKKEENFGITREINSNFNFLISLQLSNNRAIALTKDLDILEWNSDQKNNNQNLFDYIFLLQKPVYITNKVKFKKLYINSSLSMGMDLNGGIFVWGTHNDGLLGLGYNITHIESPTFLINNIKELSISDSHAVAIDQNGDIFSWGSGKYGELCLDKLIYCPKPTKKIYDIQETKSQINDNFSNLDITGNVNSNGEQRKYRKVFCSDLLTCFIDEDGKFSYYGVIIKIFKDDNSSITIKSLLKDENNSDPNFLFKEKVIYELENEKFIQISIGNGFLGLLSEKGLVYTLDHSDNITLLYTKFFVYSICVSSNQLFGLCRNSNYKHTNFPNHSIMDSFTNLPLDDEEINENKINNYYLCRWIAQFYEKDIISDSWSTQLFKIKDEIDVENMSLLDSHNKDMLFIIQYVSGYSKKLALNVNGSNEFNNSLTTSLNKENKNNRYDNSNNYFNNNLNENNSKSVLKDSFVMNLNDNKIENFNMSGLNLRKNNSLENIEFNALTPIGYFDDSYNLKYKRVKNNFHGVRIVSLDKSKNKNSLISINNVKGLQNKEDENNTSGLGVASKRKKIDVPKSNSFVNNLPIKSSMIPHIPKSPEINRKNTEKDNFTNKDRSNFPNIYENKYKNNLNNLEMNGKLSRENLIKEIQENKQNSKNFQFNHSESENIHVSNNNDPNNLNCNKVIHENNTNLKDKNFKLSTFSNFSSNDVISPSPESLVQFYNDSSKNSKKIDNFNNYKKPFKSEFENNLRLINKKFSQQSSEKEHSLLIEHKYSDINDKTFNLNKTNEKEKMINVIATFSDISSERNTTSPNKNLNFYKNHFNLNNNNKILLNRDYNDNKPNHFFPEEELNVDNENIELAKKEKVDDIDFDLNINPYKNRSNKRTSNNSLKKQPFSYNNKGDISLEKYRSGSRQIRDTNVIHNHPIKNLKDNNNNCSNNNQANNKKTSNNKGKFSNLNILDDFETEFNNNLISKSKNLQLFKNNNHSPKNMIKYNNEDPEISSNKTSEEMSTITQQSYKRQKNNSNRNENQENKYRGSKTNKFNTINGIRKSNKTQNIYDENLNTFNKNERFNSSNLNSNINNHNNFSSNNSNSQIYSNNNNNDYRKNRYHDRQTSYVPFKKDDNHTISSNKNVDILNNNLLNLKKDETDSDEKMRKSSMDKKINEFKKKLNKENISFTSNNREVNKQNNSKSSDNKTLINEEKYLNNYDNNQYNVRIIQRRIKKSKDEKIEEFNNQNENLNYILNSKKNFIEHNDQLEENHDCLKNINHKDLKIHDNSMKIGKKLSFKNFKNFKFQENSIDNNTKYFTFSPQELTIPSIKESDKILIDKKDDFNDNKFFKINDSHFIYNRINDEYKLKNHENNFLNNISNLNYNNQINDNLNENSNRINVETKKFAILKGIEIIINIYDSRVFKFIYSNLNSIYSNFFKRLSLIYEMNIHNNPISINRKKALFRSNSPNSNSIEEFNYPKKINELQSKRLDNKEINNDHIQYKNNNIDYLNQCNTQSNLNNNSSHFNRTIENNPNLKNFISKIHSNNLNGDLNINYSEDCKNKKNNNLHNENYFSFENFTLNTNNNANSLKNNVIVESVNNLENPENNSNSLYNNFKFNSFSNKNFLNNTFNRCNDNSDQLSVKNQNSNNKSTKNYNINITKHSNSISECNTVSDKKNKNNDNFEEISEILNDFDNIESTKNKELLYFTKFLIKNVLSFYKRNRSEYFFYTLKKIINHCNFNIVLGVLNKRISQKHYMTLNHYFNKFRRINKVFNGILVLNSIYYKNLFHFFSIFGHHSRLFHIKKKYLREFLTKLEVIRIHKMKKKFILSLIVNKYFDIKMPYFKQSLTSIIKLCDFNIKRKTLISMKKMYYSQKLYHRNLDKFTIFLDSILINRKLKAYKAIKERCFRNSLLTKFIKRKHIMRLYYMKKVLQKLIDNALLSDKNLFTNIKLKKALKIYYYKQKLILFKYLFKWKNTSIHLSKFIRNSEKPLRYSLSNELKSIIVKKPKLRNSQNTISNSNFFDSRLSSPTKIQNNSIKRLVNLLTYITNKATFECLYYFSFGRILSTNLKFDKSLYYINIFNTNYRIQSQASIEHFNYENQFNLLSSLNSNLYSNNNMCNTNSIHNRISFESNLESSNKNKTQLTFVCNNENITESDKFQDLQYYLMQGHNQMYQTLQLDSPNKNKNLNLPLSINNFNSLTTPKFLVGNDKNFNESIASPKIKLKNEIVRNSAVVYNNDNQNNISFLRNNNNPNNMITSPQNNYSILPFNTNNTLRKNESLNNSNSFKNSIQSSSINKNKISNKNSSNSIINDNNRSQTSKNNQKIRNSEAEKNLFLDDRRIKNKKETNYINININIKDEKSDFKKIADLFDNKGKFYLSTRNKDNINKHLNRSNSIKDNFSNNQFKTKTDFFTYKNLPFNGNVPTRRNLYDTYSWITSPLRRISRKKSNSMSNYNELNNKLNYQTDYNIDYHTITSCSKSNKSLNFPFKNYCGNNAKNIKKKFIPKNTNEDSYTYLNKLKNYAFENKNSNIHKVKVSTAKKNDYALNDLKYNNNLKYKRFTNYFNNTICNNNQLKSNFSNTYDFHSYNPSINSINTTINNTFTKNHFIILISVISEKFNKIKRFFFKKFLLFTENTERTNKKYAIRLLIKIVKRRMICHRLNFFTRISTFISYKKEERKTLNNNVIYQNTAKSEIKIVSNPLSNHRKNYSYTGSVNLNTIDHVNYPNRTSKVLSQFQKK